MKHTYYVQGMSCQGCRKHVQKALDSVPGVDSATVDLEKGEALIQSNSHIPIETLQEYLSQSGGHYSISEDLVPNKNETNKIPQKVVSTNQVNAFYCPMQCEGDKTYPKPGDCPVCGMDLVPVAGSAQETSDHVDLLARKLWISVAFTLPIFIVAMSEMVPGNIIYDWMSPVYWNWLQLFLSLPVVFYSCWMFFERAYRSVVNWNLNMFTLIGLGAGVAWLFSVVALIVPDLIPDQFKTENGIAFVYFEAATVILTLVLLGQYLEAKAHSRTSTAIKELLELAPNKAIRVQNEEEIEVDISLIQAKDILRVKPGEKIPVDGVLVEGSSHVDEAMISGEPIPVVKEIGDKVYSGTINGNRSFLMQAEKVGEETLLAQIVQLVNEASRSRAPIQNLADRISAYFVPVVVLIAVLTFVVWAILGPSPAYVYGFINAIAVLIIACPCALGLATPMSVMVGVGKGAKNGILFKNATALQQMSRVNTIVVDKTGTLTEGKPSVEEVFVLNESEIDKVMRTAASLSQLSEHPLAAAIMQYAEQNQINLHAVDNFNSITGQGVVGYINGHKVLFGNKSIMENYNVNLAEDILSKASACQKEGKTISFIAQQSELLGFVSIGDKIRPAAREVLDSLRQKGIKIYMLTGDNAATTQHIANKLAIDGFKAELRPEDKLLEISQFQENGQNVAMTGDGINDAPALAKSDVGIAMGTGTDIAIESADITLLKGDLKGILRASNLSDQVMKNIKQNLFFALVYNTLGVPLAAGILFPFFGILLSPMIAALAMSFSSVSVIANALRLQTIELD